MPVVTESPKINRPQVSVNAVQGAIGLLSATLFKRLQEKGYGTFAGRHEALGIIAEEYDELLDAVRSGSIGECRSELLDIAVGCVFAVACIDGGHIEPPVKVSDPDKTSSPAFALVIKTLGKLDTDAYFRALSELQVDIEAEIEATRELIV